MRWIESSILLQSTVNVETLEAISAEVKAPELTTLSFPSFSKSMIFYISLT